MINLYEPKTENFLNNGIANLINISNCIVTEELNGVFELEGEIPISDNNIDNEYILKVNCGYDESQLFRIKRIIPNLKTVKFYGNHITYDLKDNNLLDVYPQKLSGNAAINWIFSKTQEKHNFTSFSDITKIGTARYVNKNPITALIGDIDNCFAKIWGGEILRDNFNIKMLQKRGVNSGYKLTKTKNITGLEFSQDNSEIATRLIPKAFNGIKLPEIFIDSPIIKNYPHAIIKEIEFSDIKLKDETNGEGYDTLEELYEALREATYKLFNEDNIDKPKINVKVNFVELSKTKEYQKYKNLETLHIGDYVELNFDSYNIKLRVIKTKYNVLLERYIEIELGSLKQTFFDSTKNELNNLKSNIIQEQLPSYLNKAKSLATEQITKAMGGYVYKTQNEFFIMDTNDPNTTLRVWRWNLNGLGYSKNGIDGPYELAMTQDGQIVADFITTGKLNTNVIEGYEQLLLNVINIENSIPNLMKNVSSSNYIEISDAFEGQPLYFSFYGDMHYAWQGETTYLPFFIYDSYLKIDNGTSFERIKLPYFDLNYTDELYDEFVVENTRAYIIRRLNDNKQPLEEEIIEELENISIPLKDGYNKLYMEDFELNYSLKYNVQNGFTEKFAKKTELKLAEDELHAEVSSKVGKNEAIASINLSVEKDASGSEARIKASKVDIEGLLEVINNGTTTTINGDKIRSGSIESNNYQKDVSGMSINLDEGTFDSKNFKLDKNGSAIFSGTVSGSIFKGNTADSIEMKIGTDSEDTILPTNNSWILTRNNETLLRIGSRYWNVADLRQLIFYANTRFFTFASDKSDEQGTVVTTDEFRASKRVNSPAFNNTSLEKIKKNFEKLEDALSIINETDIYRYNLKSESDDCKKHIGLVIGKKYKYSKEILNNNEDSVDLYSMVSVCFKAIKEQQKQINKLKEEIEELKNEKNN